MQNIQNMEASILQENRPPSIATLATKNALQDLILLLQSICVWNVELPTLYIFCDDSVEEYIKNKVEYNGKICTRNYLEKYSQYTRAQMEKLPGKLFSNLFTDFTAEKTHLLDWVFEQEQNPSGVFFLDADICFTSALPLIPSGVSLALSPHYIRPGDEAKYGRYNAGFCWTNDPSMPSKWREACKTSRFFEQAALEDLVTSYSATQFYEFPLQVNYGWWRMFQAVKNPIEVLRTWSYDRVDTSHCGLTVEGKPIICIHTHFYEMNDQITMDFNRIFRERLSLCRRNYKSAMLLRLISA